MALIDRVQARIETDLDPDELQRMIDDALSDIAERYGPIADPESPITVPIEGRRRKLDLVRPIDVAEEVAVVEFLTDWGWGETETTLEAADFRVWNGGRTLERLATGPNAASLWGDRVEVTYVPVNDGNARQEVAIKLVCLAAEYDGSAERSVGDTRTVHGRGSSAGLTPSGYSEEREALLASLGPRRGLLIR